jgi:hypothetical protein
MFRLTVNCPKPRKSAETLYKPREALSGCVGEALATWGCQALNKVHSGYLKSQFRTYLVIIVQNGLDQSYSPCAKGMEREKRTAPEKRGGGISLPSNP